MKRKSVIKADDLSGKHSNRAEPENERKQQREETLEWISLTALSRLRLVWGR